MQLNVDSVRRSMHFGAASLPSSSLVIRTETRQQNAALETDPKAWKTLADRPLAGEDSLMAS
jgi:hypothetical protein